MEEKARESKREGMGILRYESVRPTPGGRPDKKTEITGDKRGWQGDCLSWYKHKQTSEFAITKRKAGDLWASARNMEHGISLGPELTQPRREKEMNKAYHEPVKISATKITGQKLIEDLIAGVDQGVVRGSDWTERSEVRTRMESISN